MPNLNKIMLIGHLGKDAESKVLPSGHVVTNFSLATTEHWKDKSGDKQERTTWHRVEVWGKAAEWCATWTKGQAVYVEGKILTDEYVSKKSGEKMTTTKVRAEQVQSLQKRESEAHAPMPAADDIPF